MLEGARHILVDRGFVLAKIADQNHQNRYQAQHLDFINTARAFGYELVDVAIKTRSSAPIDPKWKSVHCLRKVHSFWLAVRLGGAR